MDLAKIRQKARLEQENSHTGSEALLRENCTEDAPTPDAPEITLHVPVAGEIKPEVDSSAVRSQPQPELAGVHASPQKYRVREPLEVLLAGREASGCADELASSATEDGVDRLDEYLEFLCFRVSDEIYGINIMDIKEIIKPRVVTEVPRAPAFVSGVISLRGVIIPIIDMRQRLGLTREKITGRERVIVVRYGEHFSGLYVDEIIQVVRIVKECLEDAPAVLDGIDRDFVTGIGRSDGRMIILLNLENIADIHLY